MSAPAHVRRADRHVAALDGLRGIAILAVVVFHVAVMATRDASWAGRAAPPLVLWPVFAGKLGVDVFFVLSGFLVYASWRRLRQEHDGDRWTAVVEFARRRGRRIIPPYWCSLLVLIPLRTPHWLTTSDGWSNILAFASVQQFMDPQLPHRVNVVTWSLTTEVHFYLLAPLLALGLARLGWRRVLIATIAVGVVWRLAVGGTGEEAEWILGRADQFVAGMVAASLVAEHRDRRSAVTRWLLGPRAAPVLGIGAVAVAAPLGATQLLGKPLLYASTFHAIFGVVVAGFLVRLRCADRPSAFGRLLERRILVGIGVASYSLYLWHWPLLSEASRRWGPSAPVLAGAIAAAAVMTVLSYIVLERPFGASRRTSKDDQRPTTSSVAGRGRPVAALR